MKRPRDLALRFLALADRDMKTCRQLSELPDSDDEAIGFHAQQAIEKCLKAVLAGKAIPFRKTHDLVELVDLLQDRLQLTPPHVEMLDQLNPFAVTFRYDLLDLEPVNRTQLRSGVEAIRRWAEQQID
ncbi:MAG: HEPN domain-containing protein [Nitrospira sp.]|nr:HEPN domain-containing protein [Nitrospira sp.]